MTLLTAHGRAYIKRWAKVGLWRTALESTIFRGTSPWTPVMIRSCVPMLNPRPYWWQHYVLLNMLASVKPRHMVRCYRYTRSIFCDNWHNISYTCLWRCIHIYGREPFELIHCLSWKVTTTKAYMLNIDTKICANQFSSAFIMNSLFFWRSFLWINSSLITLITVTS